MSDKNEFHITVDSNDLTALDVLAKASDFSRQKIKQLMQKGCVWLENDGYTQRLRRAKKVLNRGEIIHCYFDEKIVDATPDEAVLIADEGSYSIWNKPSGMLSQGSKWGDHCTIYRWAEKHLKPERPAFIVHRLDRAASGLIILAHKKKIAAQFAEMFQKHEIKKHYRAWVEGDFSTLLVTDKAVDPVEIITTKLDEKFAETHVRLVDVAIDRTSDKVSDKPRQKQSLLDVDIKTGRKHQIRKHLAGIGFPIVGDRLYGSGKSELNLQLTAVFLSFNCPVSGEPKTYSLPNL